MPCHYYTKRRGSVNFSVMWARAHISPGIVLRGAVAAALFYYSFLYLIWRRAAAVLAFCFTAVMRFTLRLKQFSSPETLVRRACWHNWLLPGSLSLSMRRQPQNFALPNQTEAGARFRFRRRFSVLRLGPRADYGIFQCAAGRTRCFKQLCFKPPFISSFCALSRAALSPHH